MSTTDLIRAYLDVWNERDSAARETLMKSVLTGDSLYAASSGSSHDAAGRGLPVRCPGQPLDVNARQVSRT